MPGGVGPQEAGGEQDAPPPVDFEAVYVAELVGPVSGGVRRRAHVLGMLDATVDADLGRGLGWRGATARVRGLGVHGDPLSASVGDVQATSNIEAPEGVRLFEAWVEQDLGFAPASLRVGMMALDEEFALVPSTLLFVHSSPATGAAFGNSGRFGPSIYPVTSLGMRLDVDLAQGWTFRGAVADGVPGDPANPERTTVRFDRDEGLLAVAEVERVWTAAGSGVAESEVALGVWGYPGKVFEVLEQPAGPAVPADRQVGNLGGYLVAEHRVWAENETDDQGVRVYAQGGLADGRVQAIEGYLGGGFTWTGAFRGRDADVFGVGVAAARFSEPFQNAVARPELVRPEDWEVALEATYAARLADWFSLQPDLQYVWNPGGDGRIDDALILGLRGTVTF